MARSSISLIIDQNSAAPLTQADANTKLGRELFVKLLNQLRGQLKGNKRASVAEMTIDGAQPIAASTTAVCLDVVATNTLIINGQTMTGEVESARGTITCASVAADDTVTVNGVVLTAKASPVGIDQWSQAGNDTADAAALAACINAHTSALISGIIGATSAAAVVTIYAIAEGTAGNSYTLVSSDDTRLANSVIGGGVLAGGTAVSNNKFDSSTNNILTAKSIVRAINASTTSLIKGHVDASQWAGSVTLATCLVGTKILIAGHEFTARTAPIPTVPANEGDFSISGDDTADGLTLLTAINAHSVLSHYVVASQVAGVVTIRQRRGTAAMGKISISSLPGVKPSGASVTTQFAATSAVLLSSKIPGIFGNAVTSSSTGGTITVGAARLTGGTGMNVAPVRFNFGTSTQAFS